MGTAKDILGCKCPKCQKGDMFQRKDSFVSLGIPKMHQRCPNCGYKFERETGFFFGAMFVSYGLAAAQMIATFVIFWYFIGLSPLNVFLIVVFMAALLSTLNFKWSRAIWLYLFFKNEK